MPFAPDIPETLHSYFMPQVEQLAMTPETRRHGISAIVDEGIGTGGFWTVSLGDDCLFTALDVTLHEDFQMDGWISDYFCLGHMSYANAACTPVFDRRGLQAENLISYRQPAGSYGYKLEGGVRYASRSLCLRPTFFQKAASMRPDDARVLADLIASPSANELPDELARLLSSMNPADADLPGTGFRLASVVSQCMACMLDHAATAAQAQARTGGIQAERLAREADALMMRNLGERLTLNGMAADLCVSRSSLAALYKQQTGTTVSERLRTLRMEKARHLLNVTALPVTEVAHAVGYPRLSTFSQAYKAHFGHAPSSERGARDVRHGS